MTEAFISYSHEDTDFVKKLHEALQKEEREVWVDWKGIPVTADWLKEIYEAIEAADNFIFIISLNSVVSKYCGEEIAHALKHNKRLVPIVWQYAEGVHPELAKINYIFFQESNDFNTALQSLLQALDTDLNHVKQHTGFLTRALEWERTQRDSSYLLRGSHLEKAEQWFTKGAEKNPFPTAIQKEYIAESRNAQNQQDALREIRVINRPIDHETKAFISYSRKDKEFVKKLYEALKQQKQEVWVDWEGISFTADWRKEIYEGIEAADNFIFVISSNSVVSEVCGEEIAHALKHNKRLVPIVLQYAEGVHPELAKINYIFFQESDDFNTSFESLLKALDTDLAHVKEHTRLLMLALEWYRKKRNSSYLLQGSQLEEAEQWFTKGVGKQPFPTPQQQEYIDESRKAQRARYRTRLIAISTVFVISTGSAIVAGFGWKEADRLRIEAEKSELQALIQTSDVRFALNRNTIDALIPALKAGKKLQNLDTAKVNILNQQRAEVMTALGQAIYWVRERSRLKGHTSFIQSVSYSPDGEFLATASADQTVKIWNKNGQLLHTLKGHKADVISVSFSPDSQTLASASLDGTVKLWSKEGKELKTLNGHDEGVRAVSFSPDGKTLATASEDNTVRLWNSDGQEIKILNGHTDPVYTISFSPDGRTLASGSYDQTVKLWNTADGKEIKTLKGHKYTVTSVSFSPDGRTLASGSYENTVKLWNPAVGKEIRTINAQTNTIYSISFSPDSQILATGNGDRTVTLWNLKGQQLSKFAGHSGVVNSVSFSRDGRTLASASQDNTVRLWQVGYDTRLTLLTGHQNHVNHVSFSPDGKTIATAGDDNTVKLWDRQGREINSLKGNKYGIWDVNFSPDGQAIATADYNGTVKLWNLQGQLLQTMKHQDKYPAYSASFSPDNQTIATASADKTVKLWNLQGQLLHTMKHNGAVYNVSFSPDGKTIASASEDKTVKFWDFEGKEIKTLKYDFPIHNVSFSSDGKMIAVAFEDKVKLQHPDGQEIATLNGHIATIWQVIFSPDGQKIATASDDNTVKLWHKDGSLITTLTGHTAEVNGISFSPDSKYLVSGSKDTRAIVWNVQNLNLNSLLKRGCDWLHFYLINNPKSESNIADPEHSLCDGVIAQNGS